MKKKYPKCNPDNWNLIGDGNCDPSYNTEECGHDDGDCNQQNMTNETKS